jgi:hypothetical protein
LDFADFISEGERLNPGIEDGGILKEMRENHGKYVLQDLDAAGGR